ncbi:acetyltransferase (GNAT) family protein [Melghiribacillus thermohalophilus]|uniref:Acetyltransferase (GNAT) family protein n=1 Tax=Melghiribacillus thermohalophilus TaxID=1324956 RepID=A0A4R3MXQ5_9BACI|nr:GNAT family N-acetyltransferase [Melghiribacillus thermohalophilus]TCT20351.1 acetyltransferase (GNAT) family protein [Melghiribacillus thermohalophilus]
MIIEKISHQTAEGAKTVILEGFSEYFSEVREDFNPDLHDIVSTYSQKGYIFLVGLIDQKVICTGALIREDEQTGRMVRLSVAKAYRRQGLAKRMIEELEKQAFILGYSKIVIETTRGWEKPIRLYLDLGYQIDYTTSDQVHFVKKRLSTDQKFFDK